MHRSNTHPFSRTLALGFALLLIIGGTAGCDDDPGPRRDEVRVEEFEVNFDPGGEAAVVNRTVASSQYDAPEITPRVVEEGMVMAYYREQDTWTALPYTYGVESAELPAVDYTVTLGYAYEESFLEVFYEISLEDEALLEDLPSRQVKVVVFGEGVARRAGVELSDYEAVKQHFNLEN